MEKFDWGALYYSLNLLFHAANSSSPQSLCQVEGTGKRNIAAVERWHSGLVVQTSSLLLPSVVRVVEADYESLALVRT